MGNDESPFDPKYSLGLLGLIGNNTPPRSDNALVSAVTPTPGVSDLLRAFGASPPPSPHTGGAVSDLFGSGLGGIFGAAHDLGLLSQPTKSENALTSAASPSSGHSALARALTGLPPSFGGAVSDLFGSGASGGLGVSSAFGLFLAQRANPSASLSDLIDPAPQPPPPLGFGAAFSPFLSPLAPPPAPLYSPPRPQPAAPTVKRRAFFSFHYDDIWRVNVVRNAWKIDHPDSELNRSFYDSSLWESKKLEGEEAIKRLIREGVGYTSAVCVLAGAETCLRQWVRYEIARAIVDGRGLLTVQLNSIKHHVSKTAHAKGPNPLDYMAIGKVQEKAWEPPRYYLFEKQPMQDATGGWRFGWFRYSDYTLAVDLPAWVTAPATRYVTPLSNCAAEYDYIADNGHQNIGVWIDHAAKRAGR
jgi:hypothetical protein